MADFDDIKEREEGKKKMPLGMTVLFMGLIIFGLAYMYFFIPQTTGWTQVAQYEKKVKAGEAASAAKREEEKAESPEHKRMEALQKGEKIYKDACAVCHGEKLEGGIGPALTGPTFIYGSSLEDHIRVISKGTPNGMPGFEQQLGPEKIRSVTLYIHSQHKH